jgi:hypothetical protein
VNYEVTRSLPSPRGTRVKLLVTKCVFRRKKVIWVNLQLDIKSKKIILDEIAGDILKNLNKWMILWIIDEHVHNWMEICIIVHMWLRCSRDYDDGFGFVEFIHKNEEGGCLLPHWKIRQIF